MNINNCTIIIDRDDLMISYCDIITLEVVKVIKFKTLESLEDYLHNPT